MKQIIIGIALIIALAACGKREEYPQTPAPNQSVTIKQVEVEATENPCFVAIKNENKRSQKQAWEFEIRYVNVRNINYFGIVAGEQNYFLLEGSQIYTLNPHYVVGQIIEKSKDCK